MGKVKSVAETEKCKSTCKTCSHWKPQQSELEYSQYKGICTNSRWKFNSMSMDDDVMILDRDNRSEKYMGVQRFESQSDVVPVGHVTKSRYCFVTGDEFGCVHHKRKEDK